MHYSYRCFDCGRDYPADTIEENFFYLCPACGTSNRNEPLRGVLTVDYQFRHSAKGLLEEDLLWAGGRYWTVPLLFPLRKHPRYKTLRRVHLGGTAMTTQKFRGENVVIYDDSCAPTFSFKDRASILVILKAMELGITEIAAASTGNAGSSLAGIGARLGIRTHIFVPKSIPEAKRMQIQAYGANIYLVDGSYDDAFDLCQDVCKKNKWYNRNTAFNPLTIEGKKSAVVDAYIQFEKKVPEFVFVPAGDGVITAGVYKGYRDLYDFKMIKNIPKIIAVQAEGSDAIYRYWKTGVFTFKPAHSVADSICAGAPRNLYMATHAVKETGGEVVVVSDAEILAAQQTAAKELGRLVEPAAAASLAGWFKHREMHGAHKKPSMIMFTGSGLKDTSALAAWNAAPGAKSPEEWKTLL